MEPIVEKITLVEDARFDSPKSMFLGRVMGKYFIYHLLMTTCSLNYSFAVSYSIKQIAKCVHCCYFMFPLGLTGV